MDSSLSGLRYHSSREHENAVTGPRIARRRGQADRRTQTPHRRRHPGLLLTAWVTSAGVSDNTGGIRLLSQVADRHPRVAKAFTDTGYRTRAVEHGAALGIDVHVVRRDPDDQTRGFKVIAWRRIVERTLGRLMHHRRLARDYETHTHRSEAMIQLAMIDLMSRRLTRESTLDWRGT